jgi:hypothetical protein
VGGAEEPDVGGCDQWSRLGSDEMRVAKMRRAFLSTTDRVKHRQSLAELKQHHTASVRRPNGENSSR